MAARLAGLACGLLFGFGLVISGMTNPAKVLNFLDVYGKWDPSLLLVLAAAVTVAFIGFRLVWRWSSPIYAQEFQIPKASKIDRRLIAGAAVFGTGWGLGGLCPGPAISAVVTGGEPALYFVCAMIVGMILADFLFAPG